MSLPRFIVVGSIGFVVDAGIFQALHAGAGIGPYVARVPAFLVAVVVTYALNRSWTFRAGPARLDRRALAYLAAQLAGVALNYAVFAALVWSVGFFARVPVAAIVVGSAVAATFNFLAARVLFRPAA